MENIRNVYINFGQFSLRNKNFFLINIRQKNISTHFLLKLVGVTGAELYRGRISQWGCLVFLRKNIEQTIILSE